MSISLASLAVQFLEHPRLSQNTIRDYESTLMPLLQQHGRVPIKLFYSLVERNYRLHAPILLLHQEPGLPKFWHKI